MEKLNTSEIEQALTSVPQWKKSGSEISRTYQFKDFMGAMRFVNSVAEIAEKAAHHPDIDIRWNKVTLTLTTHDANGLTAKDFELAKQVDRL
ncbi:MAG TPA: 4a-hydroxytetrahydrobiopterin dehydratase [Verrucomicrobiae bacterium]|nr:4a-hydroxytetrahydrobiopterin dehydratase [Verrucomicrobiae bacterium]